MKKLFLFTLICSLGFFTACSDDDDNDTPTPTPPEVNLAKETYAGKSSKKSRIADR